VNYEAVGPRAAGPKLGQLLFHFSLPLRLRRRAFDVWCESLTPPFSTAFLQSCTHRPVVALTQILSGAAMRRKYRLPFERVERLGLRTYRHAIATSKHLRGRLLAINPRLQVEVIPNGVSGEWVRMEPRRAERHVLFLGRLDIEQKGLDLLLAALAQLDSPLPWPVVVAGAGAPDQETFLAQRIHELGLAASVRAVGRVTGAARQALFEDAAFLVLPSRFEASPLVMFEAFCYRLPVVRFAIPELEDIPDTVAVAVPPFDVGALGAAMRSLAEDPGRREALGRAAKAYVRAFDWDDLAARYARFFAAVSRPPDGGSRLA
jgi:glycosyltransferase involved in cell wall biosynthesis